MLREYISFVKRKIYSLVKYSKILGVKFKRKIYPASKYAKSLGVIIGENCSIMTKNFGSEPYLISIGNHVQLTAGVTFFTHGGAWVLRNDYPEMDFFGKIIIGNNVYIGNNALILPGVSIKDNVVIGAGAVVTKSVPEGVVVGGNPAQILGRVEDFEKKMQSYNLRSKKMSSQEKKQFLLEQPSEVFIKKTFLDFKN